jgi:cysteine desulfurase
MDKETTYVISIKKYMIEKLTSLFPNIHFNGESGDMNNSTYTVLNVCFPISNDKAAMLDFQLDLKGIACSKGSACQSGSSEGSHVLSEIQNDSHKTLPSVRFSFSHNNKKEEVDYLIDTLKEFMDS